MKLPVVDLLYSPYKHSKATFNARPPRTQYLEGEQCTSNAMFSLDLFVKVRASILVGHKTPHGQSIKDQELNSSHRIICYITRNCPPCIIYWAQKNVLTKASLNDATINN